MIHIPTHTFQKITRSLFSFLICPKRLTIIISLLFFSLPYSAMGQQESYAKITNFTGTVIVSSQVTPPIGEWRKVTEPNHPLFKGDTVKTNSGTAEITFTNDGSLIKLEEETEISIEEMPRQRAILGILSKEYLSRTVRVARGTLSGTIKERKDLTTEFETPTVVAGVRGTKLSFTYDPTTGEVKVSVEGSLDVHTVDGKALIPLSDGEVQVSVDPLAGTICSTSLSGDHEVETGAGLIANLGEKKGICMDVNINAYCNDVYSIAGEISFRVGDNTVTIDEGECFGTILDRETETVDINNPCNEIQVNGVTVEPPERPEGEECSCATCKAPLGLEENEPLPGDDDDDPPVVTGSQST